MTRRRRSWGRGQRGFTLLEVMVALAILAISLTMLLATNASNLDNAGRARDLTIASLLARSKMIDLEQKLMDEGFTVDSTEEDGDFSDDDHPDIKWNAKMTQVDLTLDNLTSLCSGFTGEGAEDDGGGTAPGGCADMLGSFGGMLEGITSEISQSMRMVELTVTWPVGVKYHESMKVAGLVTRPDLLMESATEAARKAGLNAEETKNAVTPGQQGLTGQPGQPPPPPPQRPVR